MTTSPPTVLFLCVHNAGRSQMAASFAADLAGEKIRVLSGGSDPAASLNAAAVEVMHEVDIDITSNTPSRWTEADLATADVIITMGCGDTCPVYPGKRYVDWPLDDPAGQPLDTVRRIRDEIRDRVGALVAELAP